MADTFQTKVAQLPTHKVVSQEGNVIWVEGNLRSGSREHNRHTLVMIPPTPYQTFIQNNDLRVGEIGPAAEILTSSEKDAWNITTPIVSSYGANYVRGEQVTLKLTGSGLDLPDINLTVENVDKNGGITSFSAIDPVYSPIPVEGTFAVSAPANRNDEVDVQDDESTKEGPAKSNPGVPAEAYIAAEKVSGSSDSQPTSVIATRIILGDHQGTTEGTIVQQANGVVPTGLINTTFQDLVGKDVVLIGIGEESNLSRSPFPVYAD